MKYYNYFDYSLNAFSLVFAGVNFEDIFSIILITISIISILFKLGVSIYDKIKAKDYKSIQEDIEKAKEELEQLKKLEEDKENGKEN